MCPQYPHLSYAHRVYLSPREKSDLTGPIDHRPIRRGLLALILRDRGHAPEECQRIAYEVYPE